MRKFNLNFKGYISDENRACVPDKSGIYMVFVGKPQLEHKVSLKGLIYIGQTKDLNDRLTTHDKHQLFLAKCSKGEYPYYSYALVDECDLDIVENALVYNTKLELNDKLKFNYGHNDSVRLEMGGRCGELSGCAICVDVKANSMAETYTEEEI